MVEGALSELRAQVVVLSSIDWGVAWQRHHIFAAQLAEAGREVFFVENTGFRNPSWRDLPRLWRRAANLLSVPRTNRLNTIPEGVRVITPRVLPPTWGVFRTLNSSSLLPTLARRLAAAGLRPGPTVIAYFATATTLDLIARLRPSTLVYDCASNFRGHPDAPRDFARLEAELLRAADLVVCDSNFLYEQKKAEHPRVVQIHQGVSEEFFSAKPPSPDFRRFCYYGSWIADLDPEFLTALDRHGFDVTISGFMKAPPPPRSIHLLPPVPRERLLERLENFDVFLLPHRINPFTLGVVPAKIYECLAMGRPVIAAPLPSLAPYKDLIYIAATPQEWVRVARNLPKTETPALRQARIDLAQKHTYRREFERFLGCIEDARRERAARS